MLLEFTTTNKNFPNKAENILNAEQGKSLM